MLAGGGEGKLTAWELLEDADAREQSHYAEKRIGLRIHFAGESLYATGSSLIWSATPSRATPASEKVICLPAIS